MGVVWVRVCRSVQIMERPRRVMSSPRASGPVAFVVQVGFVDDFSDFPQDGVRQVVAAQDGFEAAVAVVVGEFDAADIERCGVGG
jgi:hypothetical protein